MYVRPFVYLKQFLKLIMKYKVKMQSCFLISKSLVLLVLQLKLVFSIKLKNTFNYCDKNSICHSIDEIEIHGSVNKCTNDIFISFELNSHMKYAYLTK